MISSYLACLPTGQVSSNPSKPEFFPAFTSSQSSHSSNYTILYKLQILSTTMYMLRFNFILQV